MSQKSQNLNFQVNLHTVVLALVFVLTIAVTLADRGSSLPLPATSLAFADAELSNSWTAGRTSEHIRDRAERFAA